jgi:hypothetical protein
MRTEGKGCDFSVEEKGCYSPVNIWLYLLLFWDGREAESGSGLVSNLSVFSSRWSCAALEAAGTQVRFYFSI